MKIARNKNGSNRLQKLLGKSDDVDGLLCAAILSCFLHVMTEKHASYMALRGLRIFDEEKKKAMYEHTVIHTLQIACDQHGCIALNEVITDSEHPHYRNQLLEVVTHIALDLSKDTYGNFVVQHVRLNCMTCIARIVLRLISVVIALSARSRSMEAILWRSR
ncbi:hypothetical protein HID58_066495 [Brassica napus]|uniref:PUM-HD domain-containing protein n=1 Tax=Brassica napus TaxID=3708 RepID=A0ABQ7ZFY7_BRANA|nr:hypothetical protein HID58_066495 [Brassica napus]